MRQFRVSLTRSGDEWSVHVPDIGVVTIDEPALADFEARKLIQQHHGLSWAEADDLDIVLVDDQGRQIFVFELLFAAGSTVGTTEPAEASPYAALAADPPPGCRFEYFGTIPGLRCVCPGTTRLGTIAATVADIRDRYGLAADDLGFEKLWEWGGSREWRERMIAQLLLMVAQRARWTDVEVAELVAFLRTVTGQPPAEP